MNELYNEIESFIANNTTNTMKFGGYNSESKESFIEKLSIEREDYNFVGYVLPVNYGIEASRLRRNGDIEGALKICREHGKIMSKEEMSAFRAATILELQGNHSLAGKIIDGVNANRLRNAILPGILEKIQDDAHSIKQSEIAKKPRNKHHDEAIIIAKRTWNKYPYASKKGMYKKLYDHFGGQVSIDSLSRWIKEEKLKPEIKSRNTSFSLVL
ncbi:TPA: hypothetical protein ACIVON_001440 [Salmonella enterica subsp. enterica serovar Poona]|nr:hypothetical protein [Salmonella enterica]EKB5041433.1 hypothetical protein [Salmonella enterica]EME1067583.1 hypothetical protein [Salmonella enterica]HEC9415912.1 hypothetical protein [Salmonella enterica subsp. enterica serovar Poona]